MSAAGETAREAIKRFIHLKSLTRCLGQRDAKRNRPIRKAIPKRVKVIERKLDYSSSPLRGERRREKARGPECSRLGEPSYFSRATLNMNIEWNFFDRNADSLVTKRNMPHIDMPGHLTFVTFRLADSMPREVVEQWHHEIESCLEEHDLAGQTIEDILNADDIDESLKNELRQFKNRKWHGHLDDCHGACVLRAPHTRKLVEDSLQHFESERYDLDRFVIMPNHVHLLIQMRQGFLLRKQLTETLRYSARTVNAHLKQDGTFWQSEPFDHIVRSEAQFEYLQQYIVDNPQKARLSNGEFTLWIRK